MSGKIVHIVSTSCTSVVFVWVNLAINSSEMIQGTRELIMYGHESVGLVP